MVHVIEGEQIHTWRNIKRNSCLIWKLLTCEELIIGIEWVLGFGKGRMLTFLTLNNIDDMYVVE